MKPTTLTEAAAVPGGRIMLRCERCYREKTKLPAELAATFAEKGWSDAIADVAPRLRCDHRSGGCGGKKVTVQFWVDIWAADHEQKKISE